MNCNNLIELNLSTFNTKKVTNMSNMFKNCNNLDIEFFIFETDNAAMSVSIVYAHVKKI